MAASKTGRIALVIGGSRGIGRAITLRLAKSGFDIWFTYRGNHEAAAEVTGEIGKIGRESRSVAFDVADGKAAEEKLAPLLEERTPHVLVYNSGIARDNLMVWMTREEWDAVIGTNLTGFYNVVRPVLFPMLREKRGRIVVISSISGQMGQAGQVNYSASKAGLIGAVKALAREVGKKNILVNVVAPGVIETEMTAALPKEAILPMIPLRRYGSAEEVAAVVDFLCSEEQMYVHGQVIGVNGGMAM